MNLTKKQKTLHSKPYYDYSEGESFSLLDILLLASKNLRLILLPPFILCVLIILYLQFIARPIYSSTSKIISSSSTGGGLSAAAGLASQFGINLPSAGGEPKWVYPDIIKSSTLARKVLKRKFDTQEFGENQSLLKIISDKFDKEDIDDHTFENIIISEFLKSVNVNENLKTSVVKLTVNALEPKLAQEINLAIIEELDQHQSEYNKAKASKTKYFITERIVDVEKELNNAENKLQDFSNRNRRIDNSALLQLEQQRLDREVAVLTGVFTTLKQQLETAKIQEVKDSDYVVIIDPPEIPFKRYWPNKRLMVLMGGIFGIAIGIMITFLNETIKSSGKVGKQKINEAKKLAFESLLRLLPKSLR